MISILSTLIMPNTIQHMKNAGKVPKTKRKQCNILRKDVPWSRGQFPLGMRALFHVEQFTNVP